PAAPPGPVRNNTETPGAAYTFPAEWEQHESVWMGWPAAEYVRDRSFKDVQVEMIQALAGHVTVDLVVQHEQEAASAKALLRGKGVPHDHVRFHPVRHTDIWFRDMGPLFVRDRRGGLAVVDFRFNLWGTVEPTDPAALIDGQVDNLVAGRLKVPTIP